MITSALQGCESLQEYIDTKMEENESFYLLEIGFWRDWKLYTGYEENGISNSSKKPDKIRNELLLENPKYSI